MSLVFVWQVCLGVLPTQTALAEETVTPTAEATGETLDTSVADASTDPESSDDGTDSIPTDDGISDVIAEDAIAEPSTDELIDETQAENDAIADEEGDSVEAADVLEPQDTTVSATVAVTAVDTSAGTYTVTVSNIDCPTGVVKVQLPTWNTPGGQDDIKWNTATRNSSGTYSYTVAMSNHSWTAGTYNTHVYITDGNGAQTCVGGITQSMTAPERGATAVLSSDEMAASLMAFNPDATLVKFAVWSNKNGQDDLVWYKATKRSEGIWTLSVPIAAHRDAGDYQVHCYATVGGKQTCVDRDTFTVTSPTATLTVTPNGNDSVVTVQVSGINSPSGITRVQVPVWSEQGGQDDIIWYTLSGNASQGYSSPLTLATTTSAPGPTSSVAT